MERIFNEQIEVDSHTAAAEKDLGEAKTEISLKKFKDVDSLLKAYNSLEAEFTKRSQRLRELEGERAASKAQPAVEKDAGAGQADAVEDAERVFLKKYPDAKDYLDDIGAVADGKDVGALESAYIGLLTEKLKKQAELTASRDYVLSHIDSTIKDEIIRDFLSEISSAKPTQPVVGGQSAIMPPIRPKTLSEAKLLAEKFFRF